MLETNEQNYRRKTTEERIHNFEDILIGISQTEMQRGRKKDRTEYSKTVGQLEKV